MVKDARVFTMPYVCSGFEKDETGPVVPKSMLGGEEGEDGVAHLDIARALPDHAHFCVLSKEGDPVSHLSACAEYYENPQKAGVMRVVMHGPLAKLKVEPEQGYSLLFGVDAFSDTLAITQIPNDSAAHEKLHETS